MRRTAIFATLAATVLLLFVCDLCYGGADIGMKHVFAALTGGDCPSSVRTIVLHIRLIKAVVALLAGASLAASGLLMQTLFRNPLAGPYVLGVSSGASLGVAVFILGAPLLGLTQALGGLGIAGAAWLGSALVLGLTAAVAIRIRDIMVILILGMMFASGVSAIVQILQYLSDEESLKAFVIWTMGSLGDVTSAQLAVFVPAVLVGLLLAMCAVKPLNLLLFGEDYARTMGLSPRRSRALIFTSTVLLAGTVTAFCGPIGFIGLAMPHVARLIVGDSDHRVLLPATMLTGSAVLLLCDIVSKFFVIPVNAVTAFLGIPVVVWVVLRNR
ncbi:MAG: iron ABC transporter permease [Muribaculaceae bacterium]|nr:iron ABC transporter permease [Muribaculaceae bacterium]